MRQFCLLFIVMTWTVGIKNFVRKFADDTTIGRVIKSDLDASVIDVEIDILHDWAGKEQVRFTVMM